MPDEGLDQPTFPLNRVVAFLGPYVAVASGAVADWLLVHVHFLALFHTTHNQIASAISQVLVFGITTLVVWLGHQKWLEGYQVWAYGKHTDTGGLTGFDGPLAQPSNVSGDTGEFSATTVDSVSDGEAYPPLPTQKKKP